MEENSPQKRKKKIYLTQREREELEEQQEFFNRMVKQYAAMAAPVLSKYHVSLTEENFQREQIDKKLSISQREEDIRSVFSLIVYNENFSENDLELLYSNLSADNLKESPQPSGLNLTLRQYQSQGLSWMLERETRYPRVRDIDIRYEAFDTDKPVYVNRNSRIVTLKRPQCPEFPLGLQLTNVTILNCIRWYTCR